MRKQTSRKQFLRQRCPSLSATSISDVHRQAQVLTAVLKQHLYEQRAQPTQQEPSHRSRILTSMVLSLKYLMYSGPMYRGGLQVIRNTEHRVNIHVRDNITGSLTDLQTHLVFQTPKNTHVYIDHQHIFFLKYCPSKYLPHTYN